jgi:hypothetical protein
MATPSGRNDNIFSVASFRRFQTAADHFEQPVDLALVTTHFRKSLTKSGNERFDVLSRGGGSENRLQELGEFRRQIARRVGPVPTGRIVRRPFAGR